MDSANGKRRVTLQEARNGAILTVRARKGFAASVLGINAGPLSARYEIKENGIGRARVLSKGRFAKVLGELEAKGDESCIRLLRQSASIIRDPERSATKWFTSNELRIFGILWLAAKTHDELKVLVFKNGLRLSLCMSALQSSGLVTKTASNGSEPKYELTPKGGEFVKIAAREDMHFAAIIKDLEETVINENGRQL